MMPERIAAILKANEELTAAVSDLSGKVGRLRTSTRNVIVVSVVLALLVVAIIVSLVRSEHANNRSARLREYQVSACQTGNDQRKAQRDLWAFILKTTAENTKKGQTPAETRRLGQFQSYVQTTFADRDCTKVVPR